MVVDDSPLVRKIASDILNSDPGITVTATAATAEFAISKLERERPDVITMDIEMPGMGGQAAIREIMMRRPTPVIVLSAHARRGAQLTMEALEAGAVDFISKPTSSLSGGLDAVAAELIEKVRIASGIEMKGLVGRRETAKPAADDSTGADEAPAEKPPAFAGLRRSAAGRYELLAIGTSTGGPVALKTVLSGLPEDFPLPIVVVQHMPPVFTRAFVERLNDTCAVAVKEAEEGDPIRAGQVLIAPGDYHLCVSRFHSAPKVALSQKDPVSGHRPSVDVLMHSVALEYGSRALGLIMTGMGRDGAQGIKELHNKGGYIIAQDKESSVIFGMNREVILNGDADEVMPLRQIARALRAQACMKVQA
jgi:two-component system chemotaxis response regulator CheB